MARRKKEDIGTKVASHDEAVVAFTNNCFKDGVAMCISPMFGETYEQDGISYKFTEEVLADMVKTGKVLVTYQGKIDASLRGII